MNALKLVVDLMSSTMSELKIAMLKYSITFLSSEGGVFEREQVIKIGDLIRKL